MNTWRFRISDIYTENKPLEDMFDNGKSRYLHLDGMVYTRKQRWAARSLVLIPYLIATAAASAEAKTAKTNVGGACQLL